MFAVLKICAISINIFVHRKLTTLIKMERIRAPDMSKVKVSYHTVPVPPRLVKKRGNNILFLPACAFDYD